MRLQPISFDALPGWSADRLENVAKAFLAVTPERMVARWHAHPLLGRHDRTALNAETVRCQAAIRASQGSGEHALREAFQAHFTPCMMAGPSEPAASDAGMADRGEPGLVTGYYEPLIAASPGPSIAYTIPVYRRPPDLINLVDEAERALGPSHHTHARQTADGHVPYWTRAEIESGALFGKNLELAYVADLVEAFFLHVQGSGKLVFPDGTVRRVTYDGKNGHPYTSIGAELIEMGEIAGDEMTLARLAGWLRLNLTRAGEIMQRNRSFVFFRELQDEGYDAPHGVLDTPLIAVRSLAIDPRFHALGLPVFVAAPQLQSATPGNAAKAFCRLMFAHDVGSAIQGPHRGDIYFGSGLEASDLAGATKHPATLYPLLPKALAGQPFADGARSA